MGQTTACSWKATNGKDNWSKSWKEDPKEDILWIFGQMERTLDWGCQLGMRSKYPNTWKDGAGAHEPEFMNFSSKGVWCRSIISEPTKQTQMRRTAGNTPVHILRTFWIYKALMKYLGGCICIYVLEFVNRSWAFLSSVRYGGI